MTKKVSEEKTPKTKKVAKGTIKKVLNNFKTSF